MLVRRVVAAILDRIATAILWLLLFFFYVLIARTDRLSGIGATAGAGVLVALDVLCGVAYFAVFEGLAGASPGKAILRLRVESARAARSPGIAAAAARAVIAWGMPVAIIDVGLGITNEPAVGLLLAALTAFTLLTARKTDGVATWYDRWTGTRVVRDLEASSLFAVVAGTTYAALVVMAMVDSGLIRHRDGGNEASAIGSLRAINSAEAAYSSSCLMDGYATDLADLVKPPPDSTQGFIIPDLDRNGIIRSGYIVALERDASPGVQDVAAPDKTCNHATRQPASSYFASAVPVSPGATGKRWFATDARGTIWQSTRGPISNPIPKDATPVQ